MRVGTGPRQAISAECFVTAVAPRQATFAECFVTAVAASKPQAVFAIPVHIVVVAAEFGSTHRIRRAALVAKGSFTIFALATYHNMIAAEGVLACVTYA